MHETVTEQSNRFKNPAELSKLQESKTVGRGWRGKDAWENEPMHVETS